MRSSTSRGAPQRERHLTPSRTSPRVARRPRAPPRTSRPKPRSP